MPPGDRASIPEGLHLTPAQGVGTVSSVENGLHHFNLSSPPQICPNISGAQRPTEGSPDMQVTSHIRLYTIMTFECLSMD